MSRCFPFPPPGYEKSAKSGDNDEDLLKKEKHQEKKHKKDKRDKEKGENKERKDKDRSKDKHKEKKDRKEKHKSRRKDKDKNRTPEATRTETQAELRHEDQFGCNNHKTEKVEDVTNCREELGRRIRDEEHEAANKMVGNLASTTQRRLKSMGTSIAVEKESNKGHKMVPNIIGTTRRNENLIPSIQTKTDGMVTTNASTKQKAAGSEKFSSVTPTGPGKSHVKVRAMDDFTGPFQSKAATNEKPANVTPTEQGRNDTSQPVNKFTGLVQTRAEDMYTSYPLQNDRAPCNNVASQQNDNFLGSDQKTEVTFTTNSIQKERPGSNNVTSRQVGNAVGSIERSSFTANTMHMERSPSNNLIPDFVGAARRKSDGLGQQQAAQRSAESVDAAFLEKETVEKRTDDGLPSTNKKKERKEKRKEKKTKDGKREEHKDRDGHEKKSKRKDKDRHKEKEKEEKMSKPLVPCTENASTRAPAPDVNNKKRKEIEINGFLHEADGRPNKLPRTTASFPHPSVENGKALGLSHIPSVCSPIKLDAINKTKKETVLDNKGTLVNGKMEAPLTSVVSRPPVVIASGGTGKVSSRSSHPDEKYLNKVFCVPKMDEWPESDDQEWLFSSKKPRPLAKLEADELPEVWAKGLQIESLDVFALPYVIPF